MFTALFSLAIIGSMLAVATRLCRQPLARHALRAASESTFCVRNDLWLHAYDRWCCRELICHEAVLDRVAQLACWQAGWRGAWLNASSHVRERGFRARLDWHRRMTVGHEVDLGAYHRGGQPRAVAKRPVQLTAGVAITLALFSETSGHRMCNDGNRKAVP